jgi:cysteinyl-tRNA synthetase
MTHLTLFDSLTKSKKTFDLTRQHIVNLYLCGPTVYQEVHLGNLRPVVVFDVLQRLLLLYQQKIIYMQNLTDIDDKIIEKAHQLQLTETELTTHNIELYQKLLNDLNFLIPHKMPRITEYVDDMIRFILRLEKGGYTTLKTDGLYFSISRFEQYGNLRTSKKHKLFETSENDDFVL